ncbi:MAG: MarR family winged helix-turn-helix transcriptional regulator [Microthrixaceae bacterium]
MTPGDDDARHGDDGLLGGIVRLNLAVTGVLEELTGRHGLSPADYLVLGVVRGAPDGRSAPTAIAEVLGRTTGGMTLTLDRLVAAGWVVRSPDPDDGRRVVVELTPEGHTLALGINAELHEWEAGLVLPAERARVVATVDGLTRAIAEHRSRAAAGR